MNIEKMLESARKKLAKLGGSTTRKPAGTPKESWSGGDWFSQSSILATSSYENELLLKDMDKEIDKPSYFNPDITSNWIYWDYFYGMLSPDTIKDLPIRHQSAVCEYLRTTKRIGNLVHRASLNSWPRSMLRALRTAIPEDIDATLPSLIHKADDMRRESMPHIWDAEYRAESDIDYTALHGPCTPFGHRTSKEIIDSIIKLVVKDVEEISIWCLVDYRKNPELWFDGIDWGDVELPSLTSEEVESRGAVDIEDESHDIVSVTHKKKSNDDGISDKAKRILASAKAKLRALRKGS